MFAFSRAIYLRPTAYNVVSKNYVQAATGYALRQNYSTETTKIKELQQQPNNFSQNNNKSNYNRNTTLPKLIAIGTGVGAIFGTLLSLYDNYSLKSLDSEYKQYPPIVLKEFPKVHITKSFVNPNDKSGLEVVLFQFQTCPFCCKVRAFLDFMGISYKVVEVDAVLRQDIKWSKSKKVPTVLVRQKDEQWVQINDSSAIISMLTTYLHEAGKVDIAELANYYPIISFIDDKKKRREDILNKYFVMYKEHVPKNITKEEQELERQWRVWVDNQLVHLISPNCYRTFAEALETFKWFSDAGEWDKHFPTWERNLMVYVGAVAMYAIAKILKRRHALSDDVRSHIYDALDKWTNELKKRGGLFFGGKQPNLADLAVFGVLSSMEGCQAFKDCLEHTEIGGWFNRTKNYVGKNRGILA